MPRLRRVNCSGPGIGRRRRGRGFEFYSEDTGERVSDEGVIERIRGLVIPPAWEDVWICPHANGHLQAVGTDAAGRRQYLYHAEWRRRRDAEKFDEMLEFARALPRLRKICSRDLKLDGLPRQRVLACATRLLDHGFFRIGTETYAEQNDTYGLATMQKRHVSVRDGGLTFDYRAKGGARRVTSLVNPTVFEVVSLLKRRRGGGDGLFAYKDGNRWADVKSSDINDYIKDATRGDFSAKDFRTWNATVLAAVALAISGEAAHSKTARKKAEARAVKEVAHYLGNTPAVCRSSYIDPRVFDRYRRGWTVLGALQELDRETDHGGPMFQGHVEAAVIDLIEDGVDSPALERTA